MDNNENKEKIRKCIEKSVIKMQKKSQLVSLSTAIKYGYELSKINENKNLLIDKLTEKVFKQYNKFTVYNEEMANLKKRKEEIHKCIELEDSKNKTQVYTQELCEIEDKIDKIYSEYYNLIEDFHSGGEDLFEDGLEHFFIKELRKTKLYDSIKLVNEFDSDNSDD